MRATPIQGTPRAWLWIAVAWLGFGLINGTQTVVGMQASGMRHHWSALFAEWTLAWLVWACATPFVLALGQRFPPLRGCGMRGWAAHIAAWFGIAILDGFWVAALYTWLKPMGDSANFPSILTLADIYFGERFHIDLIVYAGILAAAYAVDSLKRLAHREAESAGLRADLSQARLDALRRQLEPHFLFNTLNGIAGLIRDRQNDAAVDMVAGLSDLLRQVVENSDRQLVTLAEELSFVERYVAIQVMRFGDRLNVVIDVAPELYGALVPTLILQPLIENAIVHGIEQRVAGGSVRVGASACDGALTIRIHNDGPPLHAETNGVGLANSRGRLRSLYETTCALDVRNHEERGVETVVTVPYRVA